MPHLKFHFCFLCMDTSQDDLFFTSVRLEVIMILGVDSKQQIVPRVLFKKRQHFWSCHM